VSLTQLKQNRLEMCEQGTVVSISQRQMDEEGHEVGQEFGHIVGAMEPAPREDLCVVGRGLHVISHSRAVGNGRIMGIPTVDLCGWGGEGQSACR
jgi:alpha-acetolactate decarboxylase